MPTAYIALSEQAASRGSRSRAVKMTRRQTNADVDMKVTEVLLLTTVSTHQRVDSTP